MKVSGRRARLPMVQDPSPPIFVGRLHVRLTGKRRVDHVHELRLEHVRYGHAKREHCIWFSIQDITVWPYVPKDYGLAEEEWKEEK